MISEKKEWALFLDRDGVINKRVAGYIKSCSEFEFKKDFLEIFPSISPLFRYIFVVTNQQGIGKGIMTAGELKNIHKYMKAVIAEINGKIDRIYYCPHLASDNCDCRKPLPGMAFMAKKDFPEVSFEKSLIIGDGKNDMEFGKSVGMKKILIVNDGKDGAYTDGTDAAALESDFTAKNFYEVKYILEKEFFK